MHHTKRIEVADATRAAITGLVFTAIALFGSVSTVRAEEAVTPPEARTSLEGEGNGTREREDNLFSVEFVDGSGNRIAVTLDEKGRVIDIDDRKTS